MANPSEDLGRRRFVDQDTFLMRRMPRLRQRLLARRRDLVLQVVHTEHDLRVLAENVEPEPIDEAQENATARCLEGVGELKRNQLHAIDAALARMARGEYGFCCTCGERIGLARLEVLPEAAACIRCADLIAGGHRPGNPAHPYTAIQGNDPAHD
jgi:RNA polymerase-binding protein DksA